MPHVTVIGGGITGLVCAFRLAQEPGLDVSLLEAGEGLGGKIQTIDLAGARVELAADAFLARDERPLRLCGEIGLTGELVEPSDFGAWIYRKGTLERLEAGTVLGFPASAKAVLRSRVLSPLGKLRAIAESFSPRPLRGPDVAVAAFTRARFGHEVLERLVDPLLAGTRGGDISTMSLSAAVPQVDRAARNHRSVMSGLRAASGGTAAPRFLAPRDGMQRLTQALGDALGGVAVERKTAVRSVAADGASYVVSSESGERRTDGIVLTVPSPVAAPLVESLSREAAAGLARIRYAASAVINLVFREGAVATPPGGSGVLVPSSEAMTLTGCSWFSAKWPALGAPGHQTVRCFVGRSAHDPALDLPDRDLVGVVAEELHRIVNVTAQPVASHVARWDAGLPIYPVGHLDQVTAIERSLAHHPRVQLAGASLRGSGIPDCIAQAEDAAARLLASLRG